jgi:hypothetical protein|tara:strand:+ start:110 stop:562 length:453 start_codon:yes stop_codon:yes gene_type:complete
MMANELKDFEPDHAKKIISYGMNSKLMEIDAGFEDNHIYNYSTEGNAYTMFVNGKPVFSIGIVILWSGVAEGWVLASQNIFELKFLAAKTMKELTDDMCKKNKIKRLQTSVKADFKLGVRFATWLGLEIEGLKKSYGPDGSDYYQLGKIY